MQIDEKKKIVEDLREIFSKSKVLIVTDYKGLNVITINELRRKLREADVEYRVVKNSLLIRASEDTDVALIKDNFKGPTAIAISYNDPVAPAKVLTQFAKDYEKLEIKAGIMDGKALDLSAIKALSELPSQEVLLGQLLSVLNGVPTSFVVALNNIPVKLLNVLQAIKEQKEAA
ncbi:MAG: 50S ribosomal protein L10 [Proteobacteria bacterium]|nr:50S ribosomal protein L10 [Pseudomonadota bacterium]MBU4287683.1 50S ribosomal protein L10 [Pseudomonadota bacterium]MCG2756977.1 50S ribosomal protein L10 [Desulfobacteraceae bacterium]